MDTSALNIERKELVDLLGKDTSGGEHAHTAVLDLRLTPLLELSSIFALGKTSRVKESSGRDVSVNSSGVLREWLNGVQTGGRGYLRGRNQS